MDNKPYTPNWYFPKAGLILLATLIFSLILSIIFVIIDLQFILITFLIADFIYLFVGYINLLLANNTFLNQISRSKLWLPILAIVFVFLGSIFRLSGRDDVGNIYISISLIIILIVVPVSWLSRLILSGQLSHILRGEQRLDKLFSFQNIQVFLISPSNPIRWFLKLLSFILVLLILLYLLSLFLFNLLP